MVSRSCVCVLLLRLCSSVLAGLVQHCAPNDPDLCFKVGRPDAAASTSPGEVFLQIHGPVTNRQYLAMGQGSMMSGSNMFIVYLDASGENVTLSPRIGRGHRMPQFSPDATVSLIEGSGVTDGKLTANIRCSSCDTWQGGSMDLSAASSDWIFASTSGDMIKSDSPSENIRIHESRGYFNLDLSGASVGASLNPFAADDVGGKEPVKSSDGYDKEHGGDSGGLGFAVPVHGLIMSLAFLIGFPAGAVLIRLGNLKSLVWVHAGLQLLTYVGVLLGAALGLYVARRGASRMHEAHPRTGLLVTLLLLAQPLLGYVHHIRFLRSRSSSVYTTAHIWYGRVLLALGLVNGFTGLRLAGQSWGVQLIYGLVAIAVSVIWVGSIVLAGRRKGGLGKQAHGQDTFRLATLDEDDEDDEFRD